MSAAEAWRERQAAGGGRLHGVGDQPPELRRYVDVGGRVTVIAPYGEVRLNMTRRLALG